MPRKILGGLIQCRHPFHRSLGPGREGQGGGDRAAPAVHRGGGQEGRPDPGPAGDLQRPYFCPSQDAHWYDMAEPVPGPTTRAHGRSTRRSTGWRWSCPSTSASRPASTTTPPPSTTPTEATSASTARTTSRTPSGFWEKYFFKPGNLGYPVFQTRFAKVGVYICYDRHFPEGARLLGLNGAEIVFNPSATVAGLSQYLWKLEQPAHAVANGYFMACSNRVGTEAPWNIGKFYGSSYFVDPRGNFLAVGVGGQGRARHGRDGPRPDRGGPPRLAVLPRPSSRDLRGDGGDRRLEDSLIRNGTVVTATDLYRGDVLVEDEKIAAIGTSLAGTRRPHDRRLGQVRPAGRHRRPHAPRHAVRRDDLGRRLRVGHDRRRARRHDVDRGLRDPVQGPDPAPGAGRTGWRRPKGRRRSTTAST